MDMRKYAGETYLKVDDVRDAPMLVQIADIKEGRFDDLNMIFETGEILSLNKTNTKILVQAYGPDSEDWLRKEIKLKLGQVKFKGEFQDSVVVEPVSPPLSATERAETMARLDGMKLSDEVRPAAEMNDEIPF
jgi:hypothetical protein